MATATHPSTSPSESRPDRARWTARVLVSEMWACVAISVMWLAVLFDALFGPDMVFISGAGTNTTTIPSAVAVAFFAYLATRIVARYGLGRGQDDT